MANPYFQFKQFTIRHDKCAMKVGTDAVLLGAWADTTLCRSILDIGTGTGIIALMLAQRCPADIDAIDIDEDACRQAQENVEASPFGGRIKIVHTSCSGFARSQAGKRYDLIVSNPPYFVNSLKCPDNKRSLARHTDSLPLPELVEDAAGMLTPSGKIALIVPYEQLNEINEIAKENELYVRKQTDVIPVPDATPKRLLIELSPEAVAGVYRETLVIEEARHQYTPEYIALTKDFYLKM